MTLPSIGEPPSNLKRRKPCAPWGWMHVCARVLLHKAARLWALLQLVHHRNKDVLVRRLPIAASCCLLQALGRVCARLGGDRKSTRLNSSHLVISYAVFCLKKKKKNKIKIITLNIKIKAVCKN